MLQVARRRPRYQLCVEVSRIALMMYATAGVPLFIISRPYGALYTSAYSKSQQPSFYPAEEITK